MALHTPIEYLKSVGPSRAETLKKEIKVFTVDDLLNYFPFRYVDRSKFYNISEINSDAAFVQLKGVIGKVELLGGPRKQRLVAEFFDQTGIIELIWFKGIQFIRNQISSGKAFIAYGKPNFFNGKVSIPHPELSDPLAQKASVSGALQPVYPSTDKLTKKGLHSKGVEKVIRVALKENHKEIKEFLPSSILSQYALMSRSEAFLNIHAPKSVEKLNKAQFRLKFEEFFLLQLQLFRLKTGREKQFKGFVFNKVGNVFNDFYQNYLPFDLTNAQKRVIKEIRRDLGSGKQMNRLLQGDVGSGKTIVAAIAALQAIEAGHQVALMAPTEILAEQHRVNFENWFSALGIQVGWLSGRLKGKKRETMMQQVSQGDLPMIVGTHALFQESVEFANLGLVIVDEQHRFGVHQRLALRSKGKSVTPHQLIMTATPIPRTLAMTAYADLDLSVIDELPPGRKPIKTVLVSEQRQGEVIERVRLACESGRQAYWVCTLIEESELLQAQAAEQTSEMLTEALAPLKVGLVHGRMKAPEKADVMQQFKSGELHLLVATTVIEVGVDVPNASLMVMANAERLGLSQLHQLRGRVGRGAQDSYCVLLYHPPLGSVARERLEIMRQTNDGFVIAQKDLEIRGPGEVLGTRQTGEVQFRLANLIRDQHWVEPVQKAADQLIAEKSEHIQPLIQRWIGEKQNYSAV